MKLYRPRKLSEYQINVKITTPRYIIFKLQKAEEKEKILKDTIVWRGIPYWIKNKSYTRIIIKNHSDKNRVS